MKKEDRDIALIELWLQRPLEKRTGNDVLIFYGWLETNRPDLVPVTRGGKDPYQALKSVLAKHVREKQRF
ncbi:MAG: hypothetical protein HY651_03555 [Acidobacteria bacterium]|nr:hypothetical protein [Acidobacteriota bacterium]